MQGMVATTREGEEDSPEEGWRQRSHAVPAFRKQGAAVAAVVQEVDRGSPKRSTELDMEDFGTSARHQGGWRRFLRHRNHKYQGVLRTILAAS